MNIKVENDKRLAKLFAPYDPIRGIGSPIERFEVKLYGDYTVWLPISMKNEPFIQHLLNSNGFIKEKVDIGTKILNHIRVVHDFEFWAYSNVKIQDKESKQLIYFKLNNPQRKILGEIEEMRLANKPIRADLVKARQYGGSTLIQIIMAWFQAILKENWHSVIVADVEDQTKRIRSMYKTFIKNYKLSKLSLLPFEGSIKNKIIPERGCIISIGSMQKPDSLRSSDNAMIHASEIGLWKETDGKSPKDLMQTLIASVPDISGTAIFRESTAKGVGNYWHSTWNSKDGYKKIFVGWHEVEIYQKELDTDEKSFFKTLDEYELFLWELGATLQGINWYRHKLREFDGDTWRMGSEFPSTITEAFQSTGRRFYPPRYIEKARKFQCKPLFEGDFHADNNSGEEALRNISFEESIGGEPKIWSKPEKTKEYSNRYIVSVDIGGTTHKADWSTINVLDRLPLLEGGGEERVALWRGHIDQDLLAWKSAQIAKYYEDATLVIEVNSLDKEEIEGTEGVNYLTVIDEIVKFYTNIYARTDPDKIAQGVPPKFGFHMNKATKPLVMNHKKKMMRTGSYIEYSKEALDEADQMEIRPNGVISAVEGCHDDIEVPTATGLYVSSKLPLPALIKKEVKTYNKNYKTRNESNFG